jgi:Lrp/AsnC family transcriptional regulator for asnA, asnC and gidA
LIETGVIKVLAVLNPEAVGFKANALIGIRVVPGKAETVRKALSSMNEVLYLAIVTGRYDILIEVLLRDPDELYDFISKHVHKIAGIVSTETYYVMRTQKFDYEWKLPEELPKG